MFKVHLRRFLILFLYLSGLSSLARLIMGRRAVILCYHRLDQADGPSSEQFRRQMEHLVQHYRPVSLDMISGWLRGRLTLPSHGAAVSFDDGYADFITKAFPILREMRITPTLFVTTGTVGSPNGMWWDQLARTPQKDLERLTGTADPREAAERIKRLPFSELERILNEITPAAPADSRDRILDWDEIKWLSLSRVDIGGHGLNHTILTCVEPEMVRWEIEDSLADLRGDSIPVRHFAYPNGDRPDFDARIEAAVQRAGFATACTTVFGCVRKKDNPYALRRIPITTESDLLFRATLHTAPIIDRLLRWYHQIIKRDDF